MAKSKQNSSNPSSDAAIRMTTAEATIAALIAHGIDTIYALPGVHNDHLFDALFKAGDRIRTIHTRHEQGAAYLALGAALATARPQAYTVVPGPGLLNSSAALLTAYGMNAPVLGADRADRPVGDRPRARPPARDPRPGRHHLPPGRFLRPHSRAGRSRAARRRRHARHGDRPARPGGAGMRDRRLGPERAGRRRSSRPRRPPEPVIDDDAIRDAAKRLGAAERPLIICGGGAQGASPEVTELSRMLQAPVLAFRRGRGVLDGRDPFSVTQPLGRDLWGEADAVLAVGTRLFTQFTQWGSDDELTIVRVDADPEEPERFRKPAVALVGDAAPILRRLVDELPAHNRKRASRKAEMEERQAQWKDRLAKLAPQIAYLEAIRAELPEDGILVDEVTQMGFAARLLFPVIKPRTFLSPGYQDNLGWGFATALGRRACPARCAGAVDLGRRRLPVHRERTRHRRAPPHSADHDRVRGRRLRQRAAHPAGALRQPGDRQRPDQSGLRALRAELRRRSRARTRSQRVARRAQARVQAAGRPDLDRGPGRPHALALGVHPHAAHSRQRLS